MIKITEKWLKEHGACSSGMEFVLEAGFIGLPADRFVENLMEAEQFDYANWLLSRALSGVNKVKYAIFCAEQVLGIYEKKYPNDTRPGKAIEAAKEYLNCVEVGVAAAYAAAYAARVADAAAAAAYAAYAAYAAAAARAAADAAAYAAAKKTIINYGLELLRDQ